MAVSSRSSVGEDKSSPGIVRAVSRALAILKAIEGNESMQLRDIAEKAQLDRATTRRLLVTLMEEGMVFQHEGSGYYSLGPMIRRLARSAVAVDLQQLLTPRLERLAAELQLTVFLSEYRDHSAVCLDRYHGHKGMEVHVWTIGGAQPLHTGAAPKLLLAWQPMAEINRALRPPLTALTPMTCVDRNKLKAQLKLIRERGWELAIDDVVVGLSALAVPLLNLEGNLRGCISLAGLTAQMVSNGKPVHLKKLQAVAEELRTLVE